MQNGIGYRRFYCCEAFLVVNNWDLIKRIFISTESVMPELVKAESVGEAAVAPIILGDVLANLTGNMLTARALGNKVWCSE